MFSMSNQVLSYHTRNFNTFCLFPARTNIRRFAIRFQGKRFKIQFLKSKYAKCCHYLFLNQDWNHFSLADFPQRHNWFVYSFIYLLIFAAFCMLNMSCSACYLTLIDNTIWFPHSCISFIVVSLGSEIIVHVHCNKPLMDSFMVPCQEKKYLILCNKCYFKSFSFFIIIFINFICNVLNC